MNDENGQVISDFRSREEIYARLRLRETRRKRPLSDTFMVYYIIIILYARCYFKFIYNTGKEQRSFVRSPEKSPDETINPPRENRLLLQYTSGSLSRKLVRGSSSSPSVDPPEVAVNSISPAPKEACPGFATGFISSYFIIIITRPMVIASLWSRLNDVPGERRIPLCTVVAAITILYARVYYTWTTRAARVIAAAVVESIIYYYIIYRARPKFVCNCVGLNTTDKLL